jgi:hypothetical protein
MASRTTDDLWNDLTAERSQLVYQAYGDTLRALLDAGIAVLVIRRGPEPEYNIPDCLAIQRDDADACAGSRRDWVRADPLYDAAVSLGSPLVHWYDPVDLICDVSQCHPVVGGVIAYHDSNHLSETFTRSAADGLRGPLERALLATSSQ